MRVAFFDGYLTVYCASDEGDVRKSFKINKLVRVNPGLVCLMGI